MVFWNLNFYFLCSSIYMEGPHKIFAPRALFSVNAPLLSGGRRDGEGEDWPPTQAKKIKSHLKPITASQVLALKDCSNSFPPPLFPLLLFLPNYLFKINRLFKCKIGRAHV